VSSANLPNPAEHGGYEELAAIADDPGMRRLAWRLAGDLADDVRQEAWYAMARACERESIENVRGYFYRTMVNIYRHMSQELGRQARPVDDLDAAAGASRRGQAVPSAENDALARLDAAARRDRLWRARARLWPMIPAYSADPYRYREVLLAVAESVAAGDGPVARAELNDALTTAYPEWFDESGVEPGTIHQRRCRARKMIWRLLATVLGPDDLRP
jgi:DNA-directed RNA polymerase specialized sigma24 family protein